MTNNEWMTIKILLTMEHQKAMSKAHGIYESDLERIYQKWIDNVEKHIRITADRETITPQELEIIRGITQSHDNIELSSDESDILARIFKAMRGIA